MKKHRAEIILICSLTLAGIIFAFVFRMGKSGSTVYVTVDGKAYGTYSLLENVRIEINGYNGGRNILVIEDGEAYITEASCPDGLCIHTGKIKRSGKCIVCLPNRVVVSIEDSGGYADVDAVTGVTYGSE